MTSAQQSTDSPELRARSGDGWSEFPKDVWAELHRVQWPSQETITKHTVIVVSLVIFMAVYIGALDWILTLAFRHVMQ